MAKAFKKPDLNAPRFRPKKLNLCNQNFFKLFRKNFPKYKEVPDATLKDIISSFNETIWQKVIELREGVELPEQLGYIFIGSCPRKKGENTDYKTSARYGVKIQNKNWESDQYTAKIFYTNYETKYRFKHHDLWGFTGVRNFKRTVGQTYPHEWKKYIMVDDLIKVSLLFRKHKYKEFKKQETIKSLEDYDEFNMD